jgi:hypothetical protein
MSVEMSKSKKKRPYIKGSWKDSDFIRSKIKEVNMDDVKSNFAWALCIVQERYDICTSAILEVLHEYCVEKCTFYRAKAKLRKGGIPGEGKTPILSSKQWKNVENRIVSEYEKGKITKTSEVSNLVC